MYRYEDYSKELNQIKTDKPGEGFEITLCGVFSSGKSSLLNYLLDCNEFRLPTGLFPVTKVVTKIKYGTELLFYFEKKNKKIPISQDIFEKTVKGEIEPPHNLSEVVVEIPSKILRSGVIIRDTPGFNDEMGGELERISRDAVMKADLVILCTSALQLGVIFEKDYIRELEKSHGNFIMVVNRMDCLNTKNDVEDIKNKAEYLMKNKGGTLLKKHLGKNLFFTVADGQFKNPDGLDSALEYLLTSGDKLSEIKESVFSKKTSDAIEKLSSKITLSLAEEQEKLEAIQEKDKRRRKELKHQLIIKNSKNQTKKDVQINRYKVKLNSHLDKIYKYINQLEQEGRCDKFSVDTKNFLTMQMSYLVSDIHADFCYDYHTPELINDFNRRVDNFTIPKPIAKSVKRRGLLQRLGETVKTAIEYGILDIDDGCDLVYENYAAPAIRAIENELKPKLQNIIEQIISWRYKSKSEDSIETGYEKEINELKEEIQKLLSVEKELRNYNAVRSAKLKEAPFRIDFIGKFASGKSTLINALIRKELLVTTFYPQPALVTKLVFNADEKVIIYNKIIGEATGKQPIQEKSIEKFFEKYIFNRNNENMFTDIDYVKLQLSETGPFNGMVEIFERPSVDFLKTENDAIISEKSDAIIYVVDANNPFTFDDMEYIKAHFAGKNPKNLFFAINRFDVILPDRIDELKRYTENRLKPVFTKKDGTFDRDLFESRVFYTNAFGSLNTRTGNPTPIQGLGEIMIPDESTGVPEFEEALDRYLKTINNK